MFEKLKAQELSEVSYSILKTESRESDRCFKVCGTEAGTELGEYSFAESYDEKKRESNHFSNKCAKEM